MDEMLDRLGATIKGALSASVTGYEVAFGELTVTAKAADIVKVATFLRDIGWFGVVAMAIFLGILVVGFVYEWKKGALEWE